MDDRGRAFEMLLSWARSRIAAGESATLVYSQVHKTMLGVLEEMRVEHQIPGTRYWENTELRPTYRFTTMAGDVLSEQHFRDCIEITRNEFYGRSLLQGGYAQRV